LRWSKPTLLCRYRYSATVSISLSIKRRGEGCGSGGGVGCPVCGGSLVDDRERGEVVCAQCGLVVAEAAVDVGPEWRAFNKEKRIRTAPFRLVVKTDMAVKPEHGARWRRLAKFHRETMHGYERRLVKIGGELMRVKECAGLPQSVAGGG